MAPKSTRAHSSHNSCFLCSRHTLVKHLFDHKLANRRSNAAQLHAARCEWPHISQRRATGRLVSARVEAIPWCELCGVSVSLFKKQIKKFGHRTSTSLTHPASMDAPNRSTSRRLTLCASPTSRLHAQRERTSPAPRQGSRRRGRLFSSAIEQVISSNDHVTNTKNEKNVRFAMHEA